VGVGSTGIGVGLASTRIEAVAVGFGGSLGTDVGGTSVGVVSTGFGAGVAFTGAGAAGPGEDDRKPTTMAALLGTSASRMSKVTMQTTSDTITRTANMTMAAIAYMALSSVVIGAPPQPHRLPLFAHHVDKGKTNASLRARKSAPWLALRSGMLFSVLLDHGKGGLRCPVNYNYCSTIWPRVKPLLH